MSLLVNIYLLAALTVTTSLTTDALAQPDMIMVSSIESDSSTNLELILTFSLKTGKAVNSDLIISLTLPPSCQEFSVFPPSYNVFCAIYLSLQSTLSSHYIYIPIIPLSWFFFSPSEYFAIRIFIISSIFSLFYRPEYFYLKSSFFSIVQYFPYITLFPSVFSLISIFLLSL